MTDHAPGRTAFVNVRIAAESGSPILSALAAFVGGLDCPEWKCSPLPSVSSNSSGDQ